jgi:hypothetical protein
MLAVCLVGAHAQSAPKPVLSTAPLTADQMEIYRDFLGGYDNGSKTPLNVAESTEPFRASDGDLKGCLKIFKPGDLTTPEVHEFSADAFPRGKVRLIDPKTHKSRDPGDAIRSGESVDNAVKAGFAAGVFTFSEVAFDSSHTHAAFSFSFVCGGLCGHGGIVVYEFDHNKWKQMYARCAQWMS